MTDDAHGLRRGSEGRRSGAEPDGPAAAAVAELARRFGRVVDASALRRAQYSSDASNYRVPPAAVAFPRSNDEVAALVAACVELGLPITSRGAGTSIAGNAIGRGLVIDFSRHLNAVLSIDPAARTAVVQPGTVHAVLQAAARKHGLVFGPDPSTHTRCTVGGMIGNNACGAHAVAWGNTRDNTVALEVLTADGRVVRAGRGGTDDAALDAALRACAAAHLAPLRTELGRFSRQASGYAQDALLPEKGFDVAGSLVGSEGTLAVLREATVSLAQEPPARALAVVGYPDMAEAAEAVLPILPLGPLALEGLNRGLVNIVISRNGASAVPPLPAGDGWLFIETGGQTPAEAAAAAEAAARVAGGLDSMVVTDPARMARMWRIREDGAGLAGRSSADNEAWPGWEDSAVPAEQLGPYLRRLQALLDDHRLDSQLYGHLGDGCIHGRIDFDLRAVGGAARMRRFLEDAADLVAEHGGSLSGEHGDGRARGELLSRMYSPAALGAFAALKAVWDPGNVLNPGVLVDPAPLDADLRVTPALPTLRGAFPYPHDHGDVGRAFHRCTGVGKCRADMSASGGVMCPSFLATRDEKDSTRGRARVLQEMVNGSLVREGWASDEVHEALDLCLACKGCASDCPTGIDMASYKAEALYRRYRRRLRPRSHYALGWLPRAARLAGRRPDLVNRLLAIGPIASWAKRIGGIDRRRALPRFAPQTFRQWFAARPPRAGSAPHGAVLLWVDTFTQSFSPEVGRAAVAVLEDAGYQVRLTERQVCCGLTWLSTGQLDGARRQLRRSLDALGPALSAGVPIVGLEPSCTAALRSDAAELLPDDQRARRLAAGTVTLAELLGRTPGWAPPQLDGASIVAQPHCHQHAVLGWDADQELLARAGASVTRVGGCCGLAGNFGVESGHYDVSVAVARTSLLPAVRAAGPDALLLADGYSCRTQLDQLAAREGIHLAQLLAARLPEADGANQHRPSPPEAGGESGGKP
ncbi:MAG: FAD-binding protein [Frankiaceae bacterium]|nr:FAD-binding protein [Frankiaceae bacterium]